MKILDHGHLFEVDCYDGVHIQSPLTITYMKRMGPGYPGNTSAYPGTNCQEVIRSIIRRVQYLDEQIHHRNNAEIIFHQRSSLYLFEERAAERHGRRLPELLRPSSPIEYLETCKKCGHITCPGGCR